jgi:hypothetical protein
LFTDSNSINLAAAAPPSPAEDEEAHSRADFAISACARVGGLKLESRTTNLCRSFEFEFDGRGAGSLLLPP